MTINEEKIVACLGSNSAAGKGQAFDWIAELRRRPQNAQVMFYNFGVGGDFAHSAAKRLPAVINSRPRKVIVWVGANDAMALVSEKFRRIFSIAKGLPCPPSSAWFRNNMWQLAERLREKSAAEVGLCSLPPIGEDLGSADPFQAALNHRIEEFSRIIADVAEQTGCRYIPLHERLRSRDSDEAREVAFGVSTSAPLRNRVRKSRSGVAQRSWDCLDGSVWHPGSMMLLDQVP